MHATRKAARATGAGMFATAEGLADLIGADNKRLAEIWDSLTGVAPVKKFTSRAVATKRIFAEVQKLAAPVAEAATETKNETTPRVTSTRKRVAARTARASAKTEPKAGSKKEILLARL